MSIYCGVHNAMLNFHMSTQVALQVELTGAIRALEGLAASMEVHVSKQIVHPIE